MIVDKKTGLRRAELSNLEAGQIHAGFIAVREGKGKKDRIVPLGDNLAALLHDFTSTMKPEEKVFKLEPGTISNKIRLFSDKAGLPHLHTHSLRHKFATDLMEKGANLRVVQELMGHENLSNTEVYLSVTEQSKRHAIRLLDEDDASSRAAKKANAEEREETADRSSTSTDVTHEDAIRRLARQLATTIRFPSINDKALMNAVPSEFKVGTYQTSLGTVHIGRNRIHVSYPGFLTAMAAPHMVESLQSHLCTSGPRFDTLLGDHGQIEQWTTNAGHCSERFLTLFRLMMNEVETYGMNFSPGEERQAGLSRWFVLTAWLDALQTATGYPWIRESWYSLVSPSESNARSDLRQLRCGAYPIGNATREETLAEFERWHKELRCKYSQASFTKEAIACSRELDTAGQEIANRLFEFSDVKRLPGHCSLC